MSKNGMVWAVGAALWLAVGTSLVKVLGPQVPAAWVAFLRSAAALPLIAAAMRLRGVAFGSPEWPSLLVRGVWGGLAAGAIFWAIPRMPLADATLLGHASPLYAALLGVLLLGETLNAAAVACLLAAFAGVLVVLKPSLSFSSAPYFAALASGMFSGLAHVAVKRLTRTEPALRILFYAAIVGSLLFLAPTLASGFVPSPAECILMVLIGLCISASQLFLTRGIGLSPVSRTSGGLFFVVAANAFMGWVFWGEPPGLGTLLGCLLIAAGLGGLSGVSPRKGRVASKLPPPPGWVGGSIACSPSGLDVEGGAWDRMRIEAGVGKEESFRQAQGTSAGRSVES